MQRRVVGRRVRAANKTSTIASTASFRCRTSSRPPATVTSTRPAAFRKARACCRCTAPSASASKQSFTRAPFARMSASSLLGEACISGQKSAWQSSAAAPVSSSMEVQPPNAAQSRIICTDATAQWRTRGRLPLALRNVAPHGFRSCLALPLPNLARRRALTFLLPLTVRPMHRSDEASRRPPARAPASSYGVPLGRRAKRHLKRRVCLL